MKSAIKHMNVGRNDFPILFNIPYVVMMTRKMVITEDVIRVKILKRSDNEGRKIKPRIARGYKPWRSVDQKKQGKTLTFIAL